MTDRANIILTAEDRTRAAFASVQERLTGISSSATALVTRFSAIGAAITTGLAGVQFRNIVNGLDALNDAADATGSSIANLSALEDAAARVGTSFETVTSTLVRFNQTLNGADPDSKIAEALQTIGLSAEELKRLDPSEALLQTAQALSRYEDSGNKARLVQELFGKSIREVAPLLKDLVEQGTLVASVTEEQTEEASRFNKQLAALQQRATAAAREIAGPLVSSLNDLFGAMERVRKNKGGVLAGIAETLQVDFLRARLQAAQDEIGRLASGAQRAQEILARQPDSFRAKAAIAEFNQAKADAERIRAEIDRILYSGGSRRPANEGGGSLRLQTVPDRPDRPTRPTRPRAAPALADQPIFGPEVPESLLQAQRLIEQTDVAKLEQLRQVAERLLAIGRTDGGADPAVSEALAKVRLEIEQLQRVSQDFVGPPLPPELQAALDRVAATDVRKIEQLRVELQQLLDLQAARPGADVAEAIKTLQAELDGLSGKVPQGLERTKQLSEELGLTFTSAFEDAVVGGRKFSDVLKGLEQDILRIVTRRFVTAPLADGLGSLLGSIAGFFGASAAGAGTVSGGTGLLANAKGNAFDNLPGLSAYSGRIVNSPTIFPFAYGAGLMGEAGPEVILPLKRGAGGRLGVEAAVQRGGDVYVSVQNNAGVEVTQSESTAPNGDRLIQFMIDQARDAAVNEIDGRILGGGSTSRAMQVAFGVQRQTLARR